MARRGDARTAELFGEELAPTRYSKAGEPAPPDYIADPNDPELLVEVIKRHSREKHELIRRYVEMCRSVRTTWTRDYGKAATYIDVYCGPGRACGQGGVDMRDGSPLVAWNTSRSPKPVPCTPFTHVFVADMRDDLRQHAHARLERAGANVQSWQGPADVTVDRVIAALPPGFHFALLDPFGLKDLPFTIIQRLVAAQKHMDLLIHVSAMGLSRNVWNNLEGEHENFNTFAPGWRDVVDIKDSSEVNVHRISQHWAQRIQDLGTQVRGAQLVEANGKPMYWLVLVSGNSLAAKFWREIEAMNPRQLALINR